MIFKTKKYWISVAFLWIPWLILCLAFYLFIFQPQTRKYKTIHAELAVSNDRVSVARLSALEDTRKRQNDLLTELQNRADKFLVPVEQKDRVVFEISRLANAYGLAEYAAKNQQDLWGCEEGEQTKMQRVWMTVTFKAPFQQFAAFLNAIERNLPAVFVESINFERVRELNKQPRAKLLIAFFAEPQTKTVTAVSDATINSAGPSS